MPIRLDHIIVPSRDRKAAARLLAELLDVPWSEDTPAGPFSPVYVNEELTLDVGELGGFSMQHYCFRVSGAEFDAILARLQARNIAYRSSPMGATDMQVRNQPGGGRNVYWSEPDGHAWEMLTVSYARMPPQET
jgi:hypothetical protein